MQVHGDQGAGMRWKQPPPDGGKGQVQDQGAGGGEINPRLVRARCRGIKGHACGSSFRLVRVKVQVQEDQGAGTGWGWQAGLSSNCCWLIKVVAQ